MTGPLKRRCLIRSRSLPERDRRHYRFEIQIIAGILKTIYERLRTNQQLRLTGHSNSLNTLLSFIELIERNITHIFDASGNQIGRGNALPGGSELELRRRAAYRATQGAAPRRPSSESS